MNKNLLSVTLFPVAINGIIRDPFESERTVDIITDSSEYKLIDEIKIKVNFKNDLLKEIKIVNDNCKNPVFFLEKKIEESWERVYLSDCFGLPIRSISPTIVKSGETFNTEICIYSTDIQDEKQDGEYRLNFHLLENETNKRLPGKYLYSNVFKIKEIL